MKYIKELDKAYLSYEGPFNILIISGIARFLSDLTIGTPAERKKIYRVFIELTQNVAMYSFDRVSLLNDTAIGQGVLYLLNLEDEFQCITINRIQPEHASVLLRNCEEINATPIDELRIKKKELYRMSTFQDTGAHIGLIMIFLYSEHLLNFEIIEEENNISYFKIIATIKKTI